MKKRNWFERTFTEEGKVIVINVAIVILAIVAWLVAYFLTVIP